MTTQDMFDTLRYRIEVDDDGTRRYYNAAGKLHREDGPAIEYATGGRMWLINGKLHRIGHPAVECSNGTVVWRLDGKLHRTDGPAIEWANGTVEWWLNDHYYTEEEFNKRKETLDVRYS